LVEGPQAVREALAHDPTGVTDIFVTEKAFEKNPDITDLATQAGVSCELVTEPVLEQMADTSTPQGIVAVHRMWSSSLAEVLEGTPKLIVVLDHVSDPGNAGTIIRVAVAAGLDAVVVTEDSVDIYNPKVVRSSTGSLFHIPIVTGVSRGDAISELSSAGLRVLAADMSGTPLPELDRSVLAQPTAWLFGNEAHGLSDDALVASDQVVSIPQFGPVESLNLAAAAAVCLYQSAVAQRS